MSRRSHRSLMAAAALSLSLGAAVFGFGSDAGAAPVNAPNSLQGTFSCGTEIGGTFTTNTGNATAAPWNVAHLLFSTGGQGVFVPSSLTFTATMVAVTPTTGDVVSTTTISVPPQVKGGGHPPSTSTCQISATEGPELTPTTGLEVSLTLTGTVVGKIVKNA